MKNCGHEDFSSTADPGNRVRSPINSSTSRRQFLRSLGALGASAILPQAAELAAQTSSQASSAKLNRIDVHHHLFSPAYLSRSGPPRLSMISDPALGNWTP